ncbi:MAG: hypothetical protein HLUCCA11_21195 [Phormidesmis priestleyi Ana]|uniref:Uncharacterized protein n=1 Tax=Phormidesmis priestleyi Ana TaxID=1666911 RepID=A0A0N8KM23_9CYAN|nr:MAG: hypothetical protein HLUCCA11_21195 [Phormidesmis priestleyi Ana]
MKVKGIKRGNVIELIDQTIDIPDGTEVTLTIDDQTNILPEAYLESLQTFFTAANLATADFLETRQADTDDTPLTNLIGSAPSSFASPEAADQFIRQERDAWDY